MTFKNVTKILVIKFKHIGDVLLSVPAVNTLREAFPKAEISYLLGAETAPIVEGHPAISKVYPLDRKSPMKAQLALMWQLRRQHFDMTVDLSGGGDRGAIWSFATGARYRIGTLPVNKGAGMAGKRFLFTQLAPVPDVWGHAVIRDLEIIRPFGIDTAEPRMDLHYGKSAADRVRGCLRERGLADDEPYLLVHPTSRWLFKCADDAAMAAVIDRIPEELGLRVVLSSGPGREELARLESVRSLCRSCPITFPGDLTLKQLAALLAGARLYLGVDSAPAHMAAALDTPALVLFGPTSARNWGPWPHDGNERPYPEESGTQRTGRHTVLQKDWECIPCGKSGCDFSKISRCLIETTPDEIIGELEQLLARTAS